MADNSTQSVSVSMPVMEMSEDILLGADEIAAFMGMQRRQVYNAAAEGYLPLFKIGALICARKTTLARWVMHKEAAAIATAFK